MIKFSCLITVLLFCGCSLNVNSSKSDDSNRKISILKTNVAGNFWTHTAFNDPCVIKNGDTYYMYLSRNTEDLYTDGRAEPVSIFYATSKDGVEWDLKSNEILSLGTISEWDYNKTETPSVVMFKGKYHMYYSGGSQYAPVVSYKIGHAVSSDGVTWSKDANNPILDKDSIPNPAAVLHVAEPGAVVIKNKIYLYYTVTSSRAVPNEPSAKMEIYLSTSDDGSSFSLPTKVLAQTSKYPANMGYLGYSTPSAIVVDSMIYLFYDVFYQTNNNINAYEQILLQGAGSSDGINFDEAPSPILERNSNSWTDREIRGGNLIYENGIVKMWFSGDNYELNSSGDWSGGMSLGLAYWSYGMHNGE